MIEINNLTKTKVNKKFFKKIGQVVLKKENTVRKNLSIALVSSERIKKLNKLYRKKDRVTDVLSFKYDNIEEQGGEIIICLEEIRKNAKINNSTFKKELTKVLIHGILHILGYEHEGNRKKGMLMEKREKYYLLRLKSIL